MFVSLEDIVRASGKLHLTIFPGAEGTLKVCVAPGAVNGKEVALATPLILTGTPFQLDQGFPDAIKTYQASRVSLEAQVEATAAVLQEAKKAQSNKAVKALDRAAANPKRLASEPDDDLDDVTGAQTGGAEDESSTDQVNRAEQSTPSSATPAPASTGTDLSSLIS